jgi:hypothetical protein
MSIGPVATHDTGIVGKNAIGEQMPVRCTVTRVGKIIHKSLSLSSVASPRRVCLAVSALIVLTLNSISCADDSRLPSSRRSKDASSKVSVLTAEEWRVLDRAIDRGLVYLSKNQAGDGSFETDPAGQPGVTGLCVLAFLARGHGPGRGPYGARLNQAVDYVLSRQDPKAGSIGPDRGVGWHWDYTCPYTHGISGIMFAEVFGMTKGPRQQRIRSAVEKALVFTRAQQTRVKRSKDDNGGWRYLHDTGNIDSDLSISAWQMMFLRAARNAEFDVPQQWVKEGLEYVNRTFDPKEGGFMYGLKGNRRYCSRATVGAGIVCLELGGQHHSKQALAAGDWVLGHPFEPYNLTSRLVDERFHYSAFYCSQAMLQLGGDYWRKFFPPFLKTFAQAQNADGSWDRESVKDMKYGKTYTTALAILSLATPYQLLPIYQR